jgi:hypothetical protein
LTPAANRGDSASGIRSTPFVAPLVAPREATRLAMINAAVATMASLSSAQAVAAAQPLEAPVITMCLLMLRSCLLSLES